jgi:peroxiredoxin
VLQQVLPENFAREAVAIVREEKERPLSEPLARILADPDFVPQLTQPHPLLGCDAVDFTLVDDEFNEVNLARLTRKGPVVLVFYYGYRCSHCVAQLFGLNEDIERFHELGAQVVAVSSDLPDLTADRFKEYGRFAFPVLSDPDHRVAEAYGVFQGEGPDGRPQQLAHATFLLGANGRIFWVNYGPKPFLDNKTLLVELARNAKVEDATDPGDGDCCTSGACRRCAPSQP